MTEITTLPQPHRRLWEAALILITALWGWSFVAIHDALADLSDSAFNAYRFLVAAVIMLPMIIARRSVISRIDIIQGGMAGAALYLAVLFQTKGLKFTSASNAAFITGLAVIFTPLILFAWFKLKPGKQQVFGTFLATTGLALLTLKGLSIQKGDVFVLMCAASFALHIVLLSRASKIANIFNIAFIQISVVGLLSLMQSIAFQELSIPNGAATINAILVVGILGTALGFYVQTQAQVASSPNRIALIIVLEPVFGGFFGYILAGDRLTILNWIGAALIVAGMLVAETRFSRQRQESGNAAQEHYDRPTGQFDVPWDPSTIPLKDD